MKSPCEKWKDALLEAALTGKPAGALASHLESCATCAAELTALEARRAQLDAVLPRITQGAELSPDFRARVLATADASAQKSTWLSWRPRVLAGAATLAAVVLAVSIAQNRRSAQFVPQEELAAAQKLAEWRAPSDGLLATPGQEFLRNVPKLGKSYLDVPAGKNQED
jgi:anti-sigma factor RsiW